jgi:putative SOS response-associated peptidase YedK
MCGRYVITSAPDALRQLFGYVELPNFPARYNVAPTQPVPVVLQDHAARHFHLMRWGLLPAWVKDPKAFTLIINARAETIVDKPAFRNALRRRRCLLPADGYYEWQDVAGRKQPFLIRDVGGAPIAFAGVAETWMGPNGEELDTVAIVTTAAEETMRALHARVPVMIAPQDFAAWLDCSAVDVEAAMALLRPPPAGRLVWHAVSTAVNRVANDGPELLLPLAAVPADEAAGPPPRRKRAPRAAARTVAPDDGQGSLF